MELIPIFCELAFIEKLVERLHRQSALHSLRENKLVLLADVQLYELIFFQSILSIDVSLSEMEKSTDPIHRFILESHGSIRINFLGESFKNSFDEKKEMKQIISTPNPIYLLSRFGYQRFNDLGMFGVKYDGSYVSKIQAITREQTFSLSKRIKENNFKGWQEIVDLALPINSAVIIDRYIIKNNKANKQNIEKILNALLPKALLRAFHLTIVIQKCDMKDVKPDSSLEEDEKEQMDSILAINAYILSLKKEYQIKMAVYAIGGNHFHDRDIITNYYWIHSGHSFDYYYYDGTVSKETTIYFKGILSNTNSSKNTYAGMKLLLNKFSRLLNDKEPKWSNGTFVNRLLT